MGVFRCYKAASNSSSKGKFKVYLCAHREEVAHYLPIIAETVLPRFPRCAVWYYDDHANGAPLPRQTFEENLSEMRLFIVPVTKNFLRHGNPALEIDFRYAREHNIPMLILLWEDELINRFNRVCGKRHVIRQSDRDYDEKVDRFLSLLFADDSLLKRMKKAFDAQIFLSYRKVDRAHAIRLIELIGKQFPNVAVWFDDYLTAGERFNSEIQRAIRESDCMVLAVTPRMLDTPHYVQRKEYPLARDLKKPVIPFEMEPTDRASLSESVLRGLDGYVHIEDEDAMRRSIEDALGKRQSKKGDDSAQRNYLIGLACLLGAGVSRDPAAGYARIKDAADAGNHEAMNKLYQMYRVGDFVQMDYRAAIDWKLKSLQALHELRYHARYGYQRARYGIAYVESALDLMDYGRELLDERFDTPDNEATYDFDFIEGTRFRVSQLLDIFAGNLFSAYPTPDTRVALAKAHSYSGRREAELHAEDFYAIRNARERCLQALGLLENAPEQTSEIRKLTAEIHLALAALIHQEISPSAVSFSTAKYEIENARAQLSQMLEHSATVASLLNALPDVQRDTTVTALLYRAYRMCANGCSISALLDRSPKTNQMCKKYRFLAIKHLRELIAERETRQRTLDLRDLYHQLLWDKVGTVDDPAERDGLLREFEATVDILAKKWNIMRHPHPQ